MNISKAISFNSGGLYDKLFNIIVYSLFIVPALIYTIFLIRPYHSGKELSFKLLITICIFILSYHSIRDRRILLHLNNLDITLAIRIIYIIVLSLLLFGQIKKLDLFIYLLAFYFIIKLNLSKNNYDANNKIFNIYRTFAVVVCLESLIIMYEFFFVNKIISNNYFQMKNYIAGSLGNPNSVAGFIVASIPFLFNFYDVNYTRSKKLLIALLICFICFSIILTQSRGAFFSLLLGVLYYAFPIIKGVINKLGGWVVKSPILLMILILIMATFYGTIKLNEKSVTGRIFIWEVSTQIIFDNPLLGIGYGNFPITFLNYQKEFFKDISNKEYINFADNIKQTHNEYLQIAIDTGLIGLFLFSIIGIYFFYFARSLLKKVNIKYKKIVRTSTMSMIIILIHSFFDNPLRVIPIYIIFLFNLAIVSYLYDTLKEHKSSGVIKKFLNFKFLLELNIRTKLMKSFMILVLFSFCFYSIKNIINSFQSYYIWLKGTELVKSGDWDKAIIEFEQVYNTSTQEGEIQYQIGISYLNTGKIDSAIKYLSIAKDTYSNKNTYVLLGIAHLKKQEFTSSLLYFKELNAIYPNLLLPHLLMAIAHIELDEKEKAEHELNTVISMKPKVDNEYSKRIKREAKILLLKTNKNKIGE